MQSTAICKKRPLLVRISQALPAALRGTKLNRQWLQRMKITIVILIGFGLHVSATTLAQKVSLSEQQAPLEKIFEEIHRQTGYLFFYNQEWLKQAHPVSLHVKNMELKEVLDLCFKDQPYNYAISDNTIYLRQKTPGSNAAQNNVPPPHDIRVHVIDSTGQPLAGASVIVKGTRQGGTTDADGYITLTGIANDAVIIISYTGYATREITAGSRSAITVALSMNANSLQDVVIDKGYYTTTQRLNTGDVSVVTAKEIGEQPVTDPLLALEGRVPGLYIQQKSGMPGGFSTVRIMGQNSIHAGNDPLYIVDGVPFTATSLTNTNIGGGAFSTGGASSSGYGLSPFNSLNPADIESIVVLKDADATAIYGSRGANGVILITTKKGKAGDTKVDVNVYTGSDKVTRTIPLLNTQQYLAMRREAFQNDGLAVPSITTSPTNNQYDINGVWDTTRYTNWQKVLLGNAAHFTNAQLSISGGNEHTQFVAGGGYTVQGFAFPGNFRDKKISGHIDLTHSSKNQKFQARFSVMYVNDNDNVPAVDLTSYIALAPDAPALYNSNGTLNWQLYNGASTWPNTNPLVYLFNTQDLVSSNLVGNASLSYELLPGLQLKTTLGYTNTVLNQTQIQPATLSRNPPFNIPANSQYNYATTTYQSFNLEPQVSYQKKLGKGQLQALIGSQFQQNQQNSIAVSARGFTNDALLSNPLNASTQSILGKQYTLYRYDALFGRIGYDWEEKYMINLTARRDGSSRFGPDLQFGNFGAVGLGWIFSNEEWLKNKKTISYGKLRASYGTVGNDQIGDYQYISTYSPVGSTTYQGSTGLYPTLIGNPYYSWEVVKKLQMGIDLGFFSDRLSLSADYYRNRDGNQLVGYVLPAITGFSSITSNFPALVQNAGGEFTLNTVNIKRKDFSWTSSINLTIPTNKLISYPGIANSSYKYTYAVGHSLFSKFVFDYAGVNPQTGIYQYYSTTYKNDTSRPLNPSDKFFSKPVTQQFYGGFQNSFTYKGFQLDVLIQFVKQLGLNYANSFTSKPGTFNFNQPNFVLGRWQQSGDITGIGKFSTIHAQDPASDLPSSTYAITDASFIRLKNIALSYQLPTAWQKKLHLQNARIYVQCQNLFTWTKYLGLDPETQGLNLPPMRVITAGVQITL